MKIHVEIDCKNAAFGNDLGREAGRILRQAALLVDRVSEDMGPVRLKDENGNTVGRIWAEKS